MAWIKTICARLTDYHGINVMVNNPVDIRTAVMAETSGLPLARVVGTGTMLDTARLRQVLGRVLWALVSPPVGVISITWPSAVSSSTAPGVCRTHQGKLLGRQPQIRWQQQRL